MLPEDIDDLFRQKLDGHPTPPGDALWARLQQQSAEEAIDAQFRAGLGGYATPPRRDVWERLEDEHLRPQPRRQHVVTWWQFAGAAMLFFGLLGGSLWRGGFLGHPTGALVQSMNDSTTAPARTSTPQAANTDGQMHITDNQNTTSLARGTTEKKQQLDAAQATARAAATSSPSIATLTRPRRTATAPRASGSFPTKGHLPDAAMGQLAGNGGQHTPAGQPLPTTATERPALVPPATKATASALAAASAPAAAPAGIIEVEVRRGGPAPATGPAPTAVAAAPATSELTPARRPRLRLGGLLRQADHLVHGEPVSLAEATGLPETVTVQAHLGSRSVSRTLQF